MAFVTVSTLYKTHFHVFPPTQLGTYTYPLGTFSTPTPIGTPTFHLEHPPQVGFFHFKFKQLLWGGI